MRAHKTKIPGVLVFEPEVHRDRRGCFFEGWRQNTYQAAGIDAAFVQDNLSISKKHVLRGIHIHHIQGQMLSVVSGKIFDVIVDMRPQSSTFCQFVSFELSSDVPRQIYMPPGYGHGFCVLSEVAIVHYKASHYYDPQSEEGVLWNDSTLAIPWPIQNPILSEKDARLPRMTQALRAK